MTRAERKLIRNLHRRKYRKEERMFLVEGPKDIEELLNSSFSIYKLFAGGKWLEQNQKKGSAFIESSLKDIQFASTYENSIGPIAIVHYPNKEKFEFKSKGIKFYFEGIQDPGNLGTVIRTADWFGFDSIFLSPGSADCFNPKVVSASKGSIFRVSVNYMDAKRFISQEKSLERTLLVSSSHSSEKSKIPQDCSIIFGNESKGTSTLFEDASEGYLSIGGAGGAESLNLANRKPDCSSKNLVSS